jgi:isocitrate dehydrogenase
MKITDGLFSRIFHEVAEEYPDVEADHKIIDIGTARLADAPEQFDVIVTPNLYGDIISDVAAEIAGSVGLAGSANIGDSCAMFEAIHGSAPDIAGKDIANPSGLIQAGVMMLVHLGQTKVAETVQNAWLRTIEEGVHTAEIHNKEFSDNPVGTTEFADAVIEHLGKVPEKFHPVIYASRTPHHEHNLDLKPRPKAAKAIVGVDLFVDWDEADRHPDALAKTLEPLNADGLKLKMITNRGVKVWPEGMPETFCTDHWRCRFTATEQGGSVTHQQIVALQQRAAEAGVDFIKTEHLCTFDGKPGYSLGQGE